MTKLHDIRLAITGTLALALLSAGCAGLVASGAQHGVSWMAPQATRQRLIYVSSVLTNDVYAYSYATHQLVGTLTGFTTPYGLCVDKSGDIWVANDGASQLLEYAHGGSSPIGTLSDTGEYPEGCAVDPTTGNLAVANFSSKSGGGNVAVYANAKGIPQTYTDSSIVNYRFCGYDAKGDLFVDGVNSSSVFVLGELPKGSSTFTNIPVKQPIEWPGGVQWDGKHVAVGDTDTVTVYQINPANGSVTGSTKFDGANYVNMLGQRFGRDAQGREKGARHRAQPRRRHARALQIPRGRRGAVEHQRCGAVWRDGEQLALHS